MLLTLIVDCVRFVDVPATDRIAVDQSVENDVCAFIVELSGGLRFATRPAFTEQAVCVVSVGRGCESFVLENGVGN